jgi:hypothetical protein
LVADIERASLSPEPNEILGVVVFFLIQALVDEFWNTWPLELVKAMRSKLVEWRQTLERVELGIKNVEIQLVLELSVLGSLLRMLLLLHRGVVRGHQAVATKDSLVCRCGLWN